MARSGNCPPSVRVFLDACREEALGFFGNEGFSAKVRQRLESDLFDLPFPEHGQDHRSGKEKWFSSLFMSFCELFEAFQSLRELPFFLRIRTLKGIPLSQGSLLAFVAEAGLNQAYIFQKRYIAFLTAIERAYAGDTATGKASLWAKELKRLADRTIFADLKALRSLHVHQARFSFSDRTMRRVQIWELLAIDGEQKQFLPKYRASIRVARQEVKILFKTMAESAELALTSFFETSNSLILDQNGRLQYPVRIMKTSAPCA